MVARAYDWQAIQFYLTFLKKRKVLTLRRLLFLVSDHIPRILNQDGHTAMQRDTVESLLNDPKTKIQIFSRRVSEACWKTQVSEVSHS